MNRFTALLAGTVCLFACGHARAGVVANASVLASVGGSSRSDAGTAPGSYVASLPAGPGAPTASGSLSWTATPSTTTFSLTGTASGAFPTLAKSELVVEFTLAEASQAWITWNLSNVAGLPAGNIAGWAILDQSNLSDPYLYALQYEDGNSAPTTSGGVAATPIGAGATGFLGLIPAGTWSFAVSILVDVPVSGGFSVAITLPSPAALPLLVAAAMATGTARGRR